MKTLKQLQVEHVANILLFVYKSVGINHQFRCTFDRIEYISGYPVLYGVLSTGIQYEHPLSVQELKNEKVIIV